MAGLRKRTVNAARLPLALWDSGGDGPPVLFLHGFLDTGRSYEDVTRLLGDRCRALCLDWRGHGESGRCGPDAAYHQLDHLKDLACVVAELEEAGETPAALVGHSLGGTVSLMLAGFRPQAVRRLLLLDCIGGYAADAATQVDQLGALLDSLFAPKRPFRPFPSRAACEERVQANNEHLSAAGAERIVRHYLVQGEDGQWQVNCDPRLRGPNPYRFPEGHWHEICRRVRAPVHVLAPEHGYLHRIEEARARFDAFADASWQDVAGVGHHVHVDAVEEVAEAVATLLQRPAPDGSSAQDQPSAPGP